MLNKILMPSGGQTTDELVILQWNKKVGDPVKRGDILFEIETDKAILTVESFAEGTLLEVRYGSGDRVRVGEVVAYVGAPGDLDNAGTAAPDESHASPGIEKPDSPPPPHGDLPQDTSTSKAGSGRSASGSSEKGDKIYASPLAKSLARKENIDLREVAKYISGNLIKKKDITAYLDHRADTAAASGKTDNAVEEDCYFVDVTAMRKTIALRMKESVLTSPHYTVSVDVDMGRAMKLRRKLNDSLKDGPVKISYNDLIMKAMAKAIGTFPLINSSFLNEKIKVYKDVHIGLAIAVDSGLVVPVVRSVSRKSLLEIAESGAQHIAKARKGKLHEKDISGGTITLSNLGMYGTKEFTAIINQPEGCILAVGAILERPVSVNRKVKIRDIMNITASFDHRTIDGALGAAFLQEVKRIMEDPHLLVL